MSTYLYGFAAGPYKEVKQQEHQKHKNIPMSLYCRESLYEYLLKLSDCIFEVTKYAMAFYENFFGYDYPYGKYDNVFVPEFNAGAMENAGIVTFNDLKIFK